MSRAQQRGAALRQELSLEGQVDARAVADGLGLTVKLWPLRVLKEMRFGDYIVVAERLEPEWRRWVVGHALGHCLLHPGNHLWIRMHTDLAHGFEREAEDFAYALLVDAEEAQAEGLVHSWEVAEYFGVPDEVLRLEPPFFQASQTTTLKDEPETPSAGVGKWSKD